MADPSIFTGATELPNTIIGLVAFVFAGLVSMMGMMLRWQNKATTSFLTYIQVKNGNLERATKTFVESMEKRDLTFAEAFESQGLRHEEAMHSQNRMHSQMLDDFAARLESTLPKANGQK